MLRIHGFISNSDLSHILDPKRKETEVRLELYDGSSSGIEAQVSFEVGDPDVTILDDSSGCTYIIVKNAKPFKAYSGKAYKKPSRHEKRTNELAMV